MNSFEVTDRRVTVCWVRGDGCEREQERSLEVCGILKAQISEHSANRTDFTQAKYVFFYKLQKKIYVHDQLLTAQSNSGRAHFLSGCRSSTYFQKEGNKYHGMRKSTVSVVQSARITALQYAVNKVILKYLKNKKNQM